jgi:hypothetical protein
VLKGKEIEVFITAYERKGRNLCVCVRVILVCVFWQASKETRNKCAIIIISIIILIATVAAAADDDESLHHFYGYVNAIDNSVCTFAAALCVLRVSSKQDKINTHTTQNENKKLHHIDGRERESQKSGFFLLLRLACQFARICVYRT